MSEDLDRVIRNIKYRIGQKEPTGFTDAVRLAEQYPEEPRVWHTLAYAHEMKNEYAAAISASTRAIELNPKEPALFFTRGGYALHTGDHERAVADFSQGLVLSDDRAVLPHEERHPGMKLESIERTNGRDAVGIDVRILDALADERDCSKKTLRRR
jgi:tetratricopeptide (TPR) repeat protein